MPERMETESRKLLRRLRVTLAERGQGQEWLDQITHLISDCIGTEVCFNCLFRDPETPQLCATEGLVGRVARTA